MIAAHGTVIWHSLISLISDVGVNYWRALRALAFLDVRRRKGGLDAVSSYLKPVA